MLLGGIQAYGVVRPCVVFPFQLARETSEQGLIHSTHYDAKPSQRRNVHPEGTIARDQC